jgi:hypothetical protein
LADSPSIRLRAGGAGATRGPLALSEMAQTRRVSVAALCRATPGQEREDAEQLRRTGIPVLLVVAYDVAPPKCF